MKRKPNLSNRCISGIYCFLRKYMHNKGITPGVHETWKDAAYCESKANIFNDRPTS